MSLFKDCWSNLLDNPLDFISNYIAPISALVEIGSTLGTWIVFLLYFISYTEMDISGYEFYDHKVFVFQGSGPRVRVSDPYCEYVENE